MNADDYTIKTSHLNQIRGIIVDCDLVEKGGDLIYPMVN